MTILCGTDFSDNASGAVRAAVLLAQRGNDDLVLVHVSAFLGWQAGLANEGELSTGAPVAKLDAALADVRLDLMGRLHREAKSLSGSGVSIRTELLQGTPDEVLTAHSKRSGARLIVVGALGRRSAQSWTLGGTADRIAQRANVPVLVVRRPDVFEKWIDGHKALCILVGIDATDECTAAITGLQSFVASAPCSIIDAHVYWPPEHRVRHGSRGPIPLGPGNSEVEQELRTELEQRLSQVRGDTKLDLRLIGGLGRPADHLVQLATELQADLIVVGNHQRTGLDKFWHGSVSHGVIDRATTNVLCIPTSGK